MDQRQELIRGLQHAQELMKEAAEVQNDRTVLQSQYICLHRLHEPWKKQKLITIGVVFGLVGMFWTPIITQMIGKMLINTGFVETAVGTGLYILLEYIFMYGVIPVGIICGIFIPRIFIRSLKKKNKILNEQNEEIMIQNKLVEVAENNVIQHIKKVNKQYVKEILSWYPSDYCYIDAAESFLHYIKNYRADNIKEAINLYLDEMHKRRMEQTQQEILNNQKAMIREQKLNNILTVGNLVMQAGIQNAVNQNTEAVNRMHNTI